MQGSFKLMLETANFDQILDALVALQREMLSRAVDLVAVLDEALGKAAPQPRGFTGLVETIGQAQAEDVRDIMRESVEMVPDFEDLLRAQLMGPAEMAKNAAQMATVGAAFAGFNANLQSAMKDMIGKLHVQPQEMTDFMRELDIRAGGEPEKEPPREQAPTMDPAAVEKQFADVRAALKAELAAVLGKGNVKPDEIMEELFGPQPPEPPKAEAPKAPGAEEQPPQIDKAGAEKQFKDANTGFKNDLGEQLKKAGIEPADIAEIMAELFPKG